MLQTSADKPQLHIQLHICNWSQSAEACSTGPCRKPGFDPWVGKFPWRREWLPTLVFLPGESPEQRSLVGYCLWGHKESYRTELLTLSLFTYLYSIIVASRWHCQPPSPHHLVLEFLDSCEKKSHTHTHTPP